MILPALRLKLKAAYMYAAGFYTYSIFALLFWETRRSDFGVSMSHHVATVVLIILSYVLRYAYESNRRIIFFCNIYIYILLVL